MITEFLNALADEREDLITCTECVDVLWEYVHDEQLGQATQSRYANIALHIKVCPHCAQEYSELQRLITPVYTELLDTPEVALDLDYSFLSSEKQETDSVLAAISQWQIEIGNLLERMVTPEPAPALMAVRSQSQNEPVLAYNKEEGDFKLEISGQTVATAPDLCTIEVRVKIPNREGPLDLDGILVQMAQGEAILFEDETDPTGRVIFEDVKREDLVDLTCIIKADPEAE